MNNIYVTNGFKDRQDYFKYLSEQYSVDLDIVEMAADLLGENEDFDGLVVAMEGWEGSCP